MSVNSHVPGQSKFHGSRVWDKELTKPDKMKKSTFIKLLAAIAFAVSTASADLPSIKLKNQPADLKTIDAKDLPGDTLVFDSAAQSLKAAWKYYITMVFGVFEDEHPLIQVYKTGPVEEQTVNNVTYQFYPMSFIYGNTKEDKIYCFCNAYGVVIKGKHKELHFDDLGMDDEGKTAVLEVTGNFSPATKLSKMKAKEREEYLENQRIAQEQAQARAAEEAKRIKERLEGPITKASLPKSNWKGPNIENALKQLIYERTKHKIVKIIIRSSTWDYERNWVGVVVSRMVKFDVIYEGKDEKGKKTIFYRPGYVAKQANINGNNFDPNFVHSDGPSSENHPISDWK